MNMKLSDQKKMKFRIEKNLGCFESVSTHEKTEQGLKATKSYFVELSEYIKDHPEPEAHEIIWDTLSNGQSGVDMSIGKKAGGRGWTREYQE